MPAAFACGCLSVAHVTLAVKCENMLGSFKPSPGSIFSGTQAIVGPVLRKVLPEHQVRLASSPSKIDSSAFSGVPALMTKRDRFTHGRCLVSAVEFWIVAAQQFWTSTTSRKL